MIKQVDLDSRDDVEILLNDFLLGIEEDQRPPVRFIEDLIDHWNNNRVEIFAKFDDSNHMRGIAVLGLTSNRISILHVNEDDLEPEEVHNIRTELFDSSFERLKTAGDWIMTGGDLLEGDLRSHAVDLGFKILERAFMTISRSTLENIEDRELPNGYSFQAFSDSLRESVTKLIFESTAGSVDIEVFPHFFSTIEHVSNLVENTIQSRFGEFRSYDDSRILMKDGTVVGICLISIRKDYGYIPDICITPALKGKGLGKALIIHTLKRLMKVHEDLMGVNLDVTLENPARFLYESLGFQEQRRYEVVNWLKNPA